MICFSNKNNPIFRSTAIVKINKKERVLALKSALTEKVIEKKLVVVENLAFDTLKTKDAIKMMEELKLDGKVLFVANEDAENLYMATRNMGNVFTSGMGDLFGVINALGSFIAVLIIDYRMFIYFVISSTILTNLNFIKTKKYGVKNRIYRDQCEKVTGLTGELVRGARDIKMLNSKDTFLDELDRNVVLENNKNIDMRNVEMNYNVLIGMIRSVLEFGAIILLVFLIKN